VARGDLSKKITVDVRGEILQLKETINTMVDQLNGFAGEVTRVAREVGTEGKRILEELGATVIGPYGGLADGLAAARSERFDGALLDFNLAGELADPLADLLIARGVPFIFITGYQRDSIDRRYANIPVLAKPLEAESLERVLVSLLEPPAHRPGGR